MQEVDPLTGMLLVATPGLIDPNFWRTVVLICRHDDDGALGVVISRPSEAAVADYLPQWVHLLVDPPVVFMGGPVQPETALALAELIEPADPEGWIGITDRIGLVDLGVDPLVAGTSIGTLRVFSGYAGWDAGQLEGEVGREDWFVVPALPDDAFSAEPGDLWRTVLRRQPDRTALYASFPPDPSLN